MSSRYFQVHYLTPDGREVRQMYFLPTPQDVRREVSQQGGVVQSIAERRRTWMNVEYYTRDYKLAFLRRLHFHIDVGISAGQGLIHLIEAEPTPAKRAEMQPALEILAQGGYFADAIAALPFMDKPIIALLQAADAAGSINDAILDAIAIMESQSNTWKTLVGAFSWIGFDLVSIVSAVYSIQFFAIPWFRKNAPAVQNEAMLRAYFQQLDTISLASIALTAATSALIVLLGLFVIALLGGGPTVKDWIYGRIARLPMLRSIFIDGALSDSFLLLSRMGKSGVPMVRSLSLLHTFAWVRVVAQFWGKVKQSVESGFDTQRAFEAGKLLSSQELTILASHQNQEHLTRILSSIAQQRRQQGEDGAKRFIRYSMVATIAYMVLVMGMVIWLLSLQNLGLSGSFEEMMKGAF